MTVRSRLCPAVEPQRGSAPPDRGSATARCLLVAVLAWSGALVAGCAGEGRAAPAAGLRVVAAFQPLHEAASAVGGERAEVTNLTPPGAGPHDLELRAPQLKALEQAQLIVYLGAGFQPDVERVVRERGSEVVHADLLDRVELRAVDAPVEGVRGKVDGEVVGADRDPHVWVDPGRFRELVDAIERAYVRADPAGRETYARNADAYRAKLAALDREFADGLGRCATRTLVTSHAAFGYLADRYELDHAPIAGISPDAEPDPRSLAATARRARADGVRTVFFESLVPRDLAVTVAREIGARTDFLDPMEGLTREQLEAGEDYFSIQRGNLRRLERGLGCTG